LQPTVVKGEFGKFGDLLDKTREKLVQATNTIDLASRKSRTLESKLNKAQRLADKTAGVAEDVAAPTLLDGLDGLD
jgi:DNA recombination protein RmuC